MLPALVNLSVRIHRQLVDRDNMAVIRRLAESCLADPEQSRVDVLQLPDHPDEHVYKGSRGERAIGGHPSLSLGQLALVIAALHDVGCSHVEKVIESPQEAEVTLSTLPEQISKEWKSNYSRSVRWFAIREKVERLTENAVPWYEAIVDTIEQTVSQHDAKTSTEMNNDANSSISLPLLNDENDLPIIEATCTPNDETATPTDERSEWEARAIGYLVQHAGEIDGLTDVWNLMKGKGYKGSRQSIYGMTELCKAAEAVGKYSPRAPDVGLVTKGSKVDGIVEAIDHRGDE